MGLGARTGWGRISSTVYGLWASGQVEQLLWSLSLLIYTIWARISTERKDERERHESLCVELGLAHSYRFYPELTIIIYRNSYSVS